MTRARMVLFGIAITAAGAVVVAFALDASKADETDGFAPPPEPPATRITDDNRARVVGRIADAARRRLVESGLPERDAAEVAELFNELVSAQLAGDYDAYAAAMAERGMRLSERGPLLVQWYYTDIPEGERPPAEPDPPPEIAALSDAELMRRFFKDTAARNAAWTRADPDDVIARTSDRPERSEVDNGAFTRYSVFEHGERAILQLASAAQAGETPDAWVMLPVTFADGSTARVKLHFVKRPDTGDWALTRYTTFGDTRHASAWIW